MSEAIHIELNPTQAMFLADDSAITGFFGGLGNGKTFAGCLKAIYRISDPKQPPQLGLIARQTYPELRDSTARTFFELLHKFNFMPGKHYTYYKQENRIKFANGHEVLFRSLDDPAKLLSINLGWFYIDQAEEASEEVYLTLLGRLRAVETPRAWITGNPLGHNWVWHRFIHDPIKGHTMHSAITAENQDNLPDGYIDSLKKNYNEIWINRYLYGSWDAFEGQIYPDWDEKVHLCNDFNPPPEWIRVIAIDHGKTNPTAIYWGALDYDDNLWIYREHYEAGQDVDYHADIIKKYMNEGLSEVYIIDPSTGAGKKDDPETIGNRYRSLGIPVSGGNNDVLGGIDKVTYFLKKNRLKVAKSCRALRREIINYQWEQPTASRVDLNQPERPLKKDDHAMDAIKYMIGWAFSPERPERDKTEQERFIDNIVTNAHFLEEAQDNGEWDNI